MADAAPAETASATQNPSPNGTSGAAATSKDISISWTDPNYKPPSGYLGNLSASQQKALDQFRKELQDEGHFVEERMDDSTLLRYLRARKWDVALAKKMLFDREKWREDFQLDKLMKCVLEFDFKEKKEVDKYYPQYYHKVDKEGRPVYVEKLGALNLTELMKITTQERQIQALVYEYEIFERERLPACSKAAGHPVETSCTILDLKGVGLGKFWDVKNYVQEAAGIGQNYYPERMGKFYIVNSSWMFTTIWSVIKGWLDPATVAKISITNSNDILKQQIPLENLPADLGGKCSCPGGCSLSDAGPWH
ncbi:hypothetical protein SCHPADRAFT_833336 [Schizopora paradoxa]|uniref:CRAL-TRIO domain-containing protein n=1 Tax=Schizopora paradoxa TaxID=27342 RepID=A0A0H2RDK6_9AGAM|nr:hypothetical protein SCHPADRAFT_833336 [Schizopora paradoxa]